VVNDSQKLGPSTANDVSPYMECDNRPRGLMLILDLVLGQNLNVLLFNYFSNDNRSVAGPFFSLPAYFLKLTVCPLVVTLLGVLYDYIIDVIYISPPQLLNWLSTMAIKAAPRVYFLTHCLTGIFSLFSLFSIVTVT
jgi:hypothetical protein